MQCLEVSGAVRPIYVSLGVKRLNFFRNICSQIFWPLNTKTQDAVRLFNYSNILKPKSNDTVHKM